MTLVQTVEVLSK